MSSSAYPQNQDNETPEQMSFDFLFDGNANGLPCFVSKPPLQMQTSYPLSVYTPLEYLCSYKYPLIVWLHSQEGTEREALHAIQKISARNYAAVGLKGFSQNNTIAWPLSRLGEIETRVLDTVRQVRLCLNIHPQRIYLVGIQSGGTAAMALALRRPDVFAGAATFNGPIPRLPVMFRQFKLQKKQSYFVGIPRQPESYPPEALRDDIDMFSNAGISIQFKEYSGKYFDDDMYKDLNYWIMRRISSAAE